MARAAMRRRASSGRLRYPVSISIITPHPIETPAGDPDGQPMGQRERNKAEKWRRILEAASRLFASQGFESTTTAAIAEEAGIGTGTLYLYVTSKEDLLVAVFRDEVGVLWDDAFAAVDRTLPLLDQLLSAFLQVTRLHEEKAELARIYFKELMFVSPVMRNGVAEFMRQFFGQLEALLDEAKANHLLDPDVPSMTLARNLWAQYFQLMQRRHAGSIALPVALTALERSFRVSLWGMVPAQS